MRISVCSVVLSIFCICSAFCSVDDNVIATVDGEIISREQLSPAASALLPAATDPADVQDIRLRAAVDFEIKLRTTSSLLASAGVKAGKPVALRYIKERCSSYGERGKTLSEALGKLVETPDFQLKCAIYYYVKSRDAGVTERRTEEFEEFYRAHQYMYRRMSHGYYLAVTCRSSQQAEDIRALLMQGADIRKTAERFNTDCRRADPQLSEMLASQNLAKRGVSSVISTKSGYTVAVCLEKPQVHYLPFDQVEPFIDEELLSRRCGAAFDKVLKHELSLKKIEYRR